MQEMLQLQSLVHHGHEQHLMQPEPSGMRGMVGTTSLLRGPLTNQRNNSGTWRCTALADRRTTAKHLHRYQSRTSGIRQSLPLLKFLYLDLAEHGCPRPPLAAGILTIHRRQIA